MASALGKGRAQCLCLFLHPPRLEPCMRLSPHTAQHLLDTSSPVTVPRHPAGAFPRVNIRVPGLLGEPTGCGPSPCGPAFPASDYYAHTATPSGLGVSLQVSPPLLPARLPIPLGASHVHDPGLLRRPVGGGYPTIPSALCGSPTRSRISRHSGAAFSPLLELRGYGFCFAFSGLQNALAVLVSKVGQGTTSP